MADASCPTLLPLPSPGPRIGSLPSRAPIRAVRRRNGAASSPPIAYALVNYGTYAALLVFAPLVAARPVLGVAGLVFNFILSKLWVFRAAISPPTNAATS